MKRLLSEFPTKSTGGRKSQIYNLAVIISVRYRVKSKNGLIFRQWANRIDERLEGKDAKEILKVIGEYSKALDLLDDYNNKTIKKVKGNIDERKIEYSDCIEIINKLSFNEESTLFAIERDKGL